MSVFVEQMECVIYFMLLPYKNISTIHSDPLLWDDRRQSWKNTFGKVGNGNRRWE